MSMEEKLQGLVAQMKVAEAYLNDLTSKEVTVARLIEEGRQAIEATKSISGKEPVQTLMPVGIGVYLPASIDPNDKLLVTIGAGVAVEKSRDEAINYIEGRVRELEAALQSILSQKQELEIHMERMRAEVNDMLKAQKR